MKASRRICKRCRCCCCYCSLERKLPLSRNCSETKNILKQLEVSDPRSRQERPLPFQPQPLAPVQSQTAGTKRSSRSTWSPGRQLRSLGPRQGGAGGCRRCLECCRSYFAEGCTFGLERGGGGRMRGRDGGRRCSRRPFWRAGRE